MRVIIRRISGAALAAMTLAACGSPAAVTRPPTARASHTPALTPARKYVADMNARYGPDLNGASASAIEGLGTSMCQIMMAVETKNPAGEAKIQQDVAKLLATKLSGPSGDMTGIVSLTAADLCPAASLPAGG